jgi:ABC-2 type transport system ATP-binding protein
MPRADLVHVSEVKVRRNGFELDVPEWRLSPGEVVGLVGPNGAGKTTLLETLAGLRPATSGCVQVLGHDPWSHPAEVRSRLGFMSDDMPVFDKAVGPLLRMLSGYYPTWDAELVELLLERFNLDPRLKCNRLSRGQGTRLRRVTSMACRPTVLILDEPAAGLDVSGRRTLLESVLDVVRDPDRSVVVSSHMLADVERIADRLLVLNEGRVVRDGPTDRLVGEHRTLEEALIDWGAAG